MMYHQKMAVAIKTLGRVLRENKDTVYLPFGVEYQVTLKNLNTVRAIVNVYIDGENVVPGGLVLLAGQEVDLERSIKNGNLTEGNRFKFIERTQAVEKGPRGVKLEDGIVRVEYQFEQVYRPSILTNSGISSPVYGGSFGSPSYNVGGVLRSADFSKGEAVKARASTAVDQYCIANNITTSSMEIHDGAATMDTFASSVKSYVSNDVGITVPGSRSDQKFQTAGWFPTEVEKHTIVLKLLGETEDNRPVTKPVTVKHKPKCQTCGKQNKATAKFCTECGTALEIFA